MNLFYFTLLYFILFYFILGGLEGGKYIYDSYLLKRQGSLEFKLKQREREHVTLKYFVLVRRNWVPFQVRLGSEEKPLQGIQEWGFYFM